MMPSNSFTLSTLLLCLLALLPLSSSTFAQNLREQKKEELAEKLPGIEERFQENRLVNREPADILAWIFMGALVGALAGTFSPLGTTLVARLIRLALGLAGAFVGGMIVRIWDIDFGWPIIEIPLVEAAFSLLGAIALVAALRGGGVYLKRRARRTFVKPLTGKGD